jgi:hypothetical protein
MKPNFATSSLLHNHSFCTRVVGRAFTPGKWRKQALAAGLTLACLIAVPQKAAAASRSETLEAIHSVENPLNTARRGRAGELGAYQFRPATWHMYTQRPFSDAADRRYSDEVAVQHYEWLKKTLTKAGIEPSTYNVALAWNAGASAVIKGRVSSFSRDYATRVDNLAVDIASHVAVK